MDERSGRRIRSVSEPALRLQCSGVLRERRRESHIGYETGRDRAALSVSRWSPDEVRPSIIVQFYTIFLRTQVCAVLYYLVCRCDRFLLNFLHTVSLSPSQWPLALLSLSQSLESVPHRDLQLSSAVSGLELRPVSTPLSREVRVRLRKSRRPQV